MSKNFNIVGSFFKTNGVLNSERYAIFLKVQEVEKARQGGDPLWQLVTQAVFDDIVPPKHIQRLNAIKHQERLDRQVARLEEKKARKNRQKNKK